MTNPYEDIIGLPHPVSKTHPRMSMHDRAAQFAPFAALTGHEDAIRETARLTDARPDLDEGEKEALNRRLTEIAARLDAHPVITVTYFREDARKAGGACLTKTGAVRKIDAFARVLMMEDGMQIPIEDVLEIEGEIE